MSVSTPNHVIPTYLRLLTITVLAVTTLPPSNYAQPAAAPVFEVATIKPSDPNKPRPPVLRFVPSRFEASNMTLKDLIAMAYDKTVDIDRQVSNGPAWTRFQKFDVVATVGESVLAELNKLPAEPRGEQSRKMIQQLLSDRFKLSVHSETREFNTFTMLLAKGGPKLKKGVLHPKLPANIPQERINRMAPGFLEGHNSTLSLLGKTLSSLPEIGGRTEIDKTGLAGQYDFTPKWTPDSAVSAESAGWETRENLPQLFTAVQEQLGLRLVSAKSPIEVIVIDSASLPSEN